MTPADIAARASVAATEAAWRAADAGMHPETCLDLAEAAARKVFGETHQGRVLWARGVTILTELRSVHAGGKGWHMVAALDDSDDEPEDDPRYCSDGGPNGSGDGSDWRAETTASLQRNA